MPPEWSSNLFTDPVPVRAKGWMPRADRSVRLVGPAWGPPEQQFGAGQDEDPAPVAQAYSRHEWDDSPAPVPAPVPVPQAYARHEADDTPAPTPVRTAVDIPRPTADTGPAVSELSTPIRRPPSINPTAGGGGRSRAPTPSPPSVPRSPAASPTESSSSAGPQPGSTLSPNRDSFIHTLTPDALAVSEETGIPWQVLMAIPANETGWGSQMGGNNLYGIKGKGPAGSFSSATWEVEGGQRKDITDTFRSYSGNRQSMEDFAKFLRDNPRYSTALSVLQQRPDDWQGFVREIHNAGYATDPAWSDKIISIGRSLEQQPLQAPTSSSAPQPGQPQPPGGGGQTVLDVGSSAVGSRYVWGGPGGRTNFDQQFAGSDCSGFFAWAYKRATGVDLPAQTQSLYSVSKPIGSADAKPGDAIFFNMGQGAHMEHVAIYAGNGMMLHDSSINPNGGVELTPIWQGAEFRRMPGIDPDTALANAPPPSVQPAQAPTARTPKSWMTYNHPENGETLAIQYDDGQVEYHPMSGGDMGAGQDEGDPDVAPVPISTDLRRHEWDSAPPTPAVSNPVQVQDIKESRPSPAPEDVSTLPPTPVASAGPPATVRADDPKPWSIPIPDPVKGVKEAVGRFQQTAQRASAPIQEQTADVPPEDKPQVEALGQYQQEAARSVDPSQDPLGLQGRLTEAGDSLLATGQPLPPGVEGPVRPAGVVARAGRGEAVNPLEWSDALSQAAGEVVGGRPGENPVGDWFPEVLKQAFNPALAPGGIENELGTAGFEVAGKAVKAGARAAAPVARDIARSAVDNLWDPLTHTFQQSWDRIMPDNLGELVSSRVPAQASPAFAAKVGVSALSGIASEQIAERTTPQSDPNRSTKLAVAGIGGLAGSFALMHYAPRIAGEINEMMAPVNNLKGVSAADVAKMKAIVAARANRLNAARGERHFQEEWIKDVLGKPGKGDNTLDAMQLLEETGAFAPGSSVRHQELANFLNKFTDDTGDEGRRLGYIRGDVVARSNGDLQAYVPRVLKKTTAATKNPNMAGVWHGRLDPRDSYTYMRKHVRLRDARAAGVEYEDSLSGAYGHYAEHALASRGNALFIKDMKKQLPGMIKRVPLAGGTSGKRVIPDGWIWGGKYLRQWQNVAFSPEMENVLKGMTEPGIQNKWFRRAQNLQAAAKGALFAPSLFHLANEVRQVYNAAGREGLDIFPKALFHAIHPGARRKFWLHPQTMNDARRALNAGLTLFRGNPEITEGAGLASQIGTRATQAAGGALTGGAAGYTDARQDPTVSEREQIQRGLEGAGLGAGGAMLGGTLSHALWEGAVPTMKFLTWKILEPKVGAEAAASFTNSVYGGQNLEAIARSRKVQDIMRFAVLAPDWQEGWIRQIGNAFRPGSLRGSLPFIPGKLAQAPTNVADLNRQYWLRAGITSAFMLEGLNLGINGHFTNDNGDGHQLTLETTGLYDRLGWDHRDPGTGEPYRTYVDLLGPYRGMIQAPGDPGKFLEARLGLVPSAAGEAFSGTDYRGEPIVQRGEDPVKAAAIRVGHLIARLAPVGPAQFISKLGRGDAFGPANVASAVSGLRVSQLSPLQQKIQDRNRRYQEHGFSVEQERQYNDEYQGEVRVAEKQYADTFADPNKTHAQIVNLAQRVDFPSRSKQLEALEPADIAADPAKHADWGAFIQSIGPIGTQSSNSPADINPTEIDVNAARDAYWRPPGKSADDMASLDPQGQQRVRETSLVEYAIRNGVDVNSLRDQIKGQERGLNDLPPLPGVTSAALDGWVQDWRGISDPDPMKQAELRRQFVDQTAQQYSLTPDAVYSRIKIRNAPVLAEDPRDPGISPQERQRRDLQTSYERAQDVLYAAHDANTYPKYAGPDGKPYKGSGPDQWKQWDDQISGARTAAQKKAPEIAALVQARDSGEAGRLKYLYNSRQDTDYQRWFGTGRNMNEKEWQDFLAVRTPQYTDTKDPTETRRRNRINELYKASTPEQRKTTQVYVMVDGQQEPTSLLDAHRHLVRVVDPKFKSHLGLDVPDTITADSGGGT